MYKQLLKKVKGATLANLHRIQDKEKSYVVLDLADKNDALWSIQIHLDESKIIETSFDQSSPTRTRLQDGVLASFKLATVEKANLWGKRVVLECLEEKFLSINMETGSCRSITRDILQALYIDHSVRDL